MNDLKISIASGKGGTGKTTIAASLASIIPNSVYIDCDVEEPNGHLLLKPKINTEEFVSKLLPKIDPFKCTVCGNCVEVCEFNALINLKFEITLIDEMCHGCGACAYFCPEKAITEIEKPIGVIRRGITEDNIYFIDGLLNIGEVAAAPLIKAVKKKIPEGGTAPYNTAIGKGTSSYKKGIIAVKNEFYDSQIDNETTSYKKEIPKGRDDFDKNDFDNKIFSDNKSFLDNVKPESSSSEYFKTYIIDSPPGTSCSMVEAVIDSDYCVLVTESTPFGLNDLKLAMEVLKTIRVPFGVVINKYDDSYREMEKYLEESKTDLLLKIPFDRKYAVSYSKGILPLVLYPELRTDFFDLYETIKRMIGLEMGKVQSV
ncbi:MAG: ATP-binding protein [Melioribacteraceae bacterium]|nr:ATP-binding protein [Melioribacteraceae bacterium]